MKQMLKAVAAAAALYGRLRRHEGRSHRIQTHKTRLVAALARRALYVEALLARKTRRVSFGLRPAGCAVSSALPHATTSRA